MLSPQFYQRPDPVRIAIELLGKTLTTEIDGVKTGGIIVETEAYKSPEDQASHAYQNRLTPRTKTMFMAGGTVYVYLCYGMYPLLNVVTGPAGEAHAVLIRAIEPTIGVAYMLERRKLSRLSAKVSAGPGLLCKALNVNMKHNASSFLDAGGELQIEDTGISYNETAIGATPRIGLNFAGEWTLTPWRFIVRGNPYLSGSKSLNWAATAAPLRI